MLLSSTQARLILTNHKQSIIKEQRKSVYDDDDYYLVADEFAEQQSLEMMLEDAAIEKIRQAEGIPVAWFNNEFASETSVATVDTYKLIDLAHLTNGPTKVDWRVAPIIPPKSTGLLAGDSGVGKTWLTLGLALDVALGQDWLGQFPTRQGKVLIVDEENADLLLRVRLAALLKARGLKPEAIPIQFLIGIGVNFTPTKDNKGRVTASSGYTKLLRTIKQYQPALVIFDSLTRCHSSNENAAGEMSQVFANVKKLVNETNTSVLFTHHIRKGSAGGNGDSGQRIRGSTDIRAFCDYTLMVDKAPDGVLVTHDKSRWSVPVAPFGVKFESTEDQFDLVYDGAKAKVNLHDVWTWVEGQLAEGQLSRAELLKRAEDAGICKQRALDKTLSWRVEHEFLVKEAVGKHVLFSLPG